MKKLCLKRLDDSKEIKQSPYYIKKYLETLCALHLRDKSLDEPLFTTQTALVAQSSHFSVNPSITYHPP